MSWNRPEASAITPPTSVPIALPSMKAVIVPVAMTMGVPKSSCSASGMKLCTARKPDACSAK
ncbi:MAG: hypothetical protein R3D28_10205 [Geminicoccaceae bacterium]